MDLKADTGALESAGGTITGVAHDFGPVTEVVESALEDASAAVAQADLQQALDEFLSTAHTMHRAIQLGLTALGDAASTSGQAYLETDRLIAAKEKID